MNALLRARPIDPENSFFKVNPGLSKREALDEASVILAGLSDILDEPSVSRRVVLLLHAAETATALVRAALEGGEVAND
ncbi:hypothetical protein ACM7UT_33435 [Pseudomonas aeruginosa]|nr:hypothetical protein [Pseudomonas aeruginosa]HBO5011087.1 hypothetical protein [Pseudomonas aeruginosa]